MDKVGCGSLRRFLRYSERTKSRYQFPDIYRGNVSEICLGLDKYRKENEREYIYIGRLGIKMLYALARMKRILCN